MLKEEESDWEEYLWLLQLVEGKVKVLNYREEKRSM